MKSEHRHELAENDLGKLIDHGRDRIEPHTNKILIALLVVTVLIVGAIAVFRTRGATIQAGAAELAAARTAAEYDAVAGEFEGSTIGVWARLRAGEEHLREGIKLSLTNRSASNESLEAAQQAFRQVLKADDVEPELHEKALYGLAVCLESLTSEQTTTKPAIEAYQELLSVFKDSRYARQANERIEALQSDRAAEFYAWFQQQNPKPEDRPAPRDFPSLPFGSDSADPFQNPADMPADAATGSGTDATDPATIGDPAATPDSATPASDPATPATDATAPATEPAAEPPAPPTSERRDSEPEPTGPALPAASDTPAEAAPDTEQPATP